MKKIILGLALAVGLMIANNASAQTKPEATNVVIKKEYKVKKFHTIDELSDMPKGKLVNLYKERIEDIFSILPYASLTTQPGITLEDLGIPTTPTNTELLRKESTDSEALYLSVDKIISLLVPYSDTKDIVWSILLFEDVIKKLNVGNDL